MKARGYLVRVPAVELDETFLGLEVLITTRALAVAGAISDVYQCAPTSPDCPDPGARLFFGFGATHTHLWVAGRRLLLGPGATVVAAPPEVALEPATP